MGNAHGYDLTSGCPVSRYPKPGHVIAVYRRQLQEAIVGLSFTVALYLTYTSRQEFCRKRTSLGLRYGAGAGATSLLLSSLDPTLLVV